MKRVALCLLIGCGLLRSVASAEEATADDYLKFYRGILGQWTGKVQIGAKTGEGTYSARLSPTKRCIISSSSQMLHYGANSALEGFDPVDKKWKWTAFSETGEVFIAMISANPAQLRGKEATFQFETAIANPDGTRGRFHGQFHVVLGKDRWEQSFTDVTLNDEKQPDEYWVYTRVKKAQ